MPEPDEGVFLRARMDTVRWQALAGGRVRLPRGWHSALLQTGSLTARLRGCCGERFAVRVLAETPARLSWRDARAMGLPVGAPIRLREVYLCCGEEPVVYACSLLPQAAARGRWRGLMRLGSRPLGELLFAHPDVRRGPMMLGCLQPGSIAHRALSRGLAAPPGMVWGRRSHFALPEATVVVCEFFLPAALDVLHDKRPP
jgi:chorismate--pyruvate lyase